MSVQAAKLCWNKNLIGSKVEGIELSWNWKLKFAIGAVQGWNFSDFSVVLSSVHKWYQFLGGKIFQNLIKKRFLRWKPYKCLDRETKGSKIQIFNGNCPSKQFYGKKSENFARNPRNKIISTLEKPKSMKHLWFPQNLHALFVTSICIADLYNSNIIHNLLSFDRRNIKTKHQ